MFLSTDMSDSYIGRMEKVIREQCRKNLVMLDKLWTEMGLSETQINERVKTVGDRVSAITTDMVECDRGNRGKMVSRCEEQKEQIRQKLQILGVQEEMEDGLSNLTLSEQNKQLSIRLQELEQREEEMMDKYRWSKEEEGKLTLKLDIPALDLDCVPSSENVTKIEEHIAELHRVEEEREQSIFTMKEEIMKLSDALDMDLNTTSLTTLLVMNDQQLDFLRQRDLDLVKCRLKDLRAQAVNRQTEMKEMMEQIEVLYEKMDVSQDDQCPLITGHVSAIEELIKTENMELVEEELRKLKKLRLTNIGKIVERSEAMLVVLWNDCMVGDKARKVFLDAACEDPEEEVQRIDRTIKEMQIYNEKNQEVLKVLKKFLNRCELAKELQLRLLDPNRLFKSRGNAMAKEEADRRTVNTLPALKKELLEFARTREDLIVFDTCMSSLVEEKVQLLERIYQSSLSTTVPSKTTSNQHGRGAAFKTNRSVQSPRFGRRQGRQGASSELRRVSNHSSNRISKSTAQSSRRKTGSIRIGVEETPRARPGQSATRARFHLQFPEPKILVQDASTVDEHVFQENIPYNSTRLTMTIPLAIVPESSFQEGTLGLNVDRLKTDQEDEISISNQLQNNLLEMKSSVQTKES